MKTVWPWSWNREINETEIRAQKKTQLYVEAWYVVNIPRLFPGGEDGWCWENWFRRGEKQTWIFILHHKQRWTPDRLKPKYDIYDSVGEGIFNVEK